MKILRIGVIVLIGLLGVSVTSAQDDIEPIIIDAELASADQVAWSMDSSLMAILMWPDISVWDTQDWQLLYTIPEVTPEALAWHPTEYRFATLHAVREERIAIWDGLTGALETEIIRQIPDDIPGTVVLHSLDWSPDGTWIASDSVLDTMTRWDVEAETFTTLVPPLDPAPNQGIWLHNILELEFSHNGEYLLSGATDQTVRVWDAETGENILLVEGSRFVAWHREDTYFAAGNYNLPETFLVNIWNMETTQIEMQFLEHTNFIVSVDWNADGRNLVSTDADNNLFIWSAETGEQLDFDIPENIEARSAYWSPDGSQLAVVTFDNVMIFDW